MGIEREFQSYGAQLVNRAWAVSAITDDPREVVVSIWQHNIVERDGRWIYDDSLARWNGAGKNLLKQHLGVAYREGLPLRAVVWMPMTPWVPRPLRGWSASGVRLP